jgi:hypothetical protein
MFAHSLSTAAEVLVAAGITFQILASVRLGARIACRRLQRHRRAMQSLVGGNRARTTIPRDRYRRRDYGAALRHPHLFPHAPRSG